MHLLKVFWAVPGSIPFAQLEGKIFEEEQTSPTIIMTFFTQLPNCRKRIFEEEKNFRHNDYDLPRDRSVHPFAQSWH